MPSINDTKHKLTDKEIVTSVDSDDTIFVNIDGAVKQIAIKDALQVEGGIDARVTAVESDVDELNSTLNTKISGLKTGYSDRVTDRQNETISYTVAKNGILRIIAQAQSQGANVYVKSTNYISGYIYMQTLHSADEYNMGEVIVCAGQELEITSSNLKMLTLSFIEFV